MDQRKIAIIVAVILTAGFYFMYTSSIVYWDAYAYEVVESQDVVPEMTITVTSSEFADYPGVAHVLGEAKNDDWSVATPENDDFYKFEAFLTLWVRPLIRVLSILTTMGACTRSVLRAMAVWMRRARLQ